MMNKRVFLPFLLACLTLCHSSFAEDDWKLLPLKYNNPGLNVDLGVGLWAWPMPTDYDNDGDIDLLVACPDKPSNGVYYFENPTQDRSNKQPVFKPAVRLGPAGHNMQISFPNGQPHILRNGFEYVPDAQTGKYNFSKPTKIYPKTNVHNRGVRGNMWRYVDFEGDGDHDLIVGVGDWTDLTWDHAYDASGDWKNGPLHGYIYLITNEGTDTAPKYSSKAEKLSAGGGEIDVFGWPSPNFADFDSDGDLDLLCGEFMDGFTYFENVGTRSKPAYAAGEKLTLANGEPLVMHLQMITPTAFDWDADGDLDLIVGDEDGRVALVENTGELKGRKPIFSAPVYFQQQADTLKFGALATPYAYDWDADGDQDIICGNTAGNIAFFENLETTKSGEIKWAAPELLTAKTSKQGPEKVFRILAGPNGSIQGPCEAKWGYTTLSVTDWDADGDPDIIYNSILSKVGLLKNENGTLVDTVFDTGLAEAPPAWYWWQTLSSDALTQWRTTPVAVDFNTDGQMDLVMLDQQGYLTFRPNGKAAQRIFVTESLEPLRLNSKTCGGSGRVKLDVVDWDGDGRLDVLVNSQNATWYRNVASVDGKQVMKKVGNLAKRNVAGHTSSPAACDFNKDNKPDLLVGAENGRLYYIAHDDCLSFKESQLQYQPKQSNAKPKFPGLKEEEFIYTKAPFKECHASSVVETSRGLVAAWFGGTKEGKEDVCIWTSYHDGSRWSSPSRAADGIQHNGLRYPCWNPVLYQTPGDGPLYLFFKVGPKAHAWWGEMMISYDRGRTFRERRRLPEGIDGPVRCKPILLADGKTLLCGSSTEHEGWRVHFETISLNNGYLSGHWNRIGPLNTGEKFSAIQPTILTHADGRLQALCRTKQSVIVSTFSSDQGKTWSELEPIDLPNPNSGIEVVSLKDGRHLLIYNHLGSGVTGWGRRGLLNLAISDDGLEWHAVGVLEKEKGEFSYPAIIQTEDGLVHATYTWKRERFKHVVLDPAKFQKGKKLSLEPWE